MTKQMLLSPALDRKAYSKVPTEVRKRRKSRFSQDLLQKHPWLFVGDEGGFCIPCKLFCTELSKPRLPGEFLVKPFATFSRKKLCEEHEKAKYHVEAQSAALSYVSIALGHQPNIKVQVGRKKNEDIKRRARLHSVVKCLIHCAKQGQALRGSKIEKASSISKPLTAKKGDAEIVLGDVNRGSFLHTLSMRLDAGDTALNCIVNNRSTYASPSAQNELLAIIAKQLREQIVKRVGDGPFAIIADETTDSSNKEQLCVAIRYVYEGNEAAPDIEERFLTFTALESLKGL